MNKYSSSDLYLSLSNLGISRDSVLLVHSGLHTLGGMYKVRNADIPGYIYDTIIRYIGEKGTLVVPAFFYDYSRKNIPFDLSKSPPCRSLGNFPRYIYENKNYARSKHPLTSLAAVGYMADRICNKTNCLDYGIGSAWDELCKLNATILFLGVPLSISMTFIHYIEFLVGVPHMYTKLFKTPVTNDGETITNRISSYVRYLNFDVNVDQTVLQRDLIDNGILKTQSIGAGTIQAANCQDILMFCIEKLVGNSSYFLKAEPKFEQNKIPLI